MIVSFGRVIKFSIQDIYRNIWLSLVTIIILILALFTVNMLLVVKVVGDAAVGAIKDKIDVNLFLKNSAEEDEIDALRVKVSNLAEVKEVSYISKSEALESFKEKHRDNAEILEALRELGKNPLTPSLVIKPKDLEIFDDLINHLNTFDDEIIESRNFTNYKLLLTQINNITDKVTRAGYLLSGIFIFITILVVYNSVRVAIYTHRRQITIMRLVGASRWFIQMPYLLSGIIYALVSIIAIMFMFYPFLSLLQPYLETFFVGYNINLIEYYYGSILTIFGVQFLAAAVINMVAAYLAVRKYSRV
ncbi:hypothetical protein DRH27_01740 [Candidatus Falkowbacteria bacterium]|nr:MAG: hypothetical protein DRH27_01740 [Candidatus Falkowbacteria bacterium]